MYSSFFLQISHISRWDVFVFQAKIGQYDGEKTFIRAYISKENNNNAPKSDSEFIFGSTVYHHVYKTQTVVIKTNKFDFTMSAKGLSTINVKPAKEWFNYTEFISNIEGRKQLGYVSGNKNGKIAIKLLPSHVVVASKPEVEIIVSKSVYQSIEKSIKNKSVLGWLVGGAQFRAPQVKTLNDDGSAEFYSKEEIESGVAAATADEMIVEMIDDTTKHANEFQNSDLERFFDETSRYAQMMEHRGKTESDWFLGWGETRHETVVHNVKKQGFLFCFFCSHFFAFLTLFVQ